MNNILEHQQGSVIIDSLGGVQTDALKYDPKGVLKFAGQYVLQKFIQSWHAHGARNLQVGHRPVFETPKYGTLYELWVEFRATIKFNAAAHSENSYVVVPPLLALELCRSFEWQTRSGTMLNKMFPEQILQKVLRMPYHKRRRYLRAMGGTKAVQVKGKAAAETVTHEVNVMLPLMFDMFDDPRTQPDTLATVETQFMLEGRPITEWLSVVDSSTIENTDQNARELNATVHKGLGDIHRRLGTLTAPELEITTLDFHYYYRIYKNPFRISLRKALHSRSGSGTSPARFVDTSYYLEANRITASSTLSFINQGRLTEDSTGVSSGLTASNPNAEAVTEPSLQLSLSNSANREAGKYRTPNQTFSKGTLSMEVELRCDQPVISTVIAVRFGKASPLLRAFYRQLFAMPRLDKSVAASDKTDFSIKFLEASSVLWEGNQNSLGWESEMTGLSFYENLAQVDVAARADFKQYTLYDADADLSKPPPIGYIVIDWGQFYKYHNMRTAITFKNLSNPKFVLEIPELVDNVTVSKLLEPVPIGPMGAGNNSHEAVTVGGGPAVDSHRVFFQSPLDARFHLQTAHADDVVATPPTQKYDFYMEVYHQVVQMLNVSYDPDYRNSVIDREREN